MWDGPPGWLSSPKRSSRWPPGGWHGLLDGIRLGTDGDSFLNRRRRRWSSLGSWSSGPRPTESRWSGRVGSSRGSPGPSWNQRSVRSWMLTSTRLASTRPPAGGSTSVTGMVRRRCRPRSGRCGSSHSQGQTIRQPLTVVTCAHSPAREHRELSTAGQHSGAFREKQDAAPTMTCATENARVWWVQS